MAPDAYAPQQPIMPDCMFDSVPGMHPDDSLEPFHPVDCTGEAIPRILSAEEPTHPLDRTGQAKDTVRVTDRLDALERGLSDLKQRMEQIYVDIQRRTADGQDIWPTVHSSAREVQQFSQSFDRMSLEYSPNFEAKLLGICGVVDKKDIPVLYVVLDRYGMNIFDYNDGLDEDSFPLTILRKGDTQPTRAGQETSCRDLNAEITGSGSRVIGNSMSTVSLGPAVPTRHRRYTLRASLWDWAVLLASREVDNCVSIYSILLLLMNAFLQGVFLVVCENNFTSPDITDDIVQSAVYFRETFSHDQKFMDGQSLTSLADRLCRFGSENEKYKLETAANQANLLDHIGTYLRDDGSSIDRLFNGRAVCMLALSCWCISVANELESCLDLFFALLKFPRGLHTELEMREDGLSFSQIGTVSVRDLLLNAMALDFVMNLDELLFEAFAPDRASQLVEMFAPMTVGHSRSFGGTHHRGGVELRTLISALCVPAVVVGCLNGPAFSMLQNMKGVVEALCDPPLDFTWGPDAFHFVQLSGTPRADDYSILSTAAVQEVLQMPLSTFTDIPASMVYSQNPNQWNMQVAAAIRLSQSEVVDLYNPTCKDLLATSQDGLAAQVHILLGGSSCLWINNNTEYCTDFSSDHGQLMRAICPITCGCDDPLSSLPVNSQGFGCPSSCKSTEKFQSRRLAASCRDTNVNTLKRSVYWSPMVQFMNRSDAKLSRALEDRGCEFLSGLVSNNVQFDLAQLCQGTHQSGMKSIALMCPEACACEDRSSEMCSYGPSSPWCSCLYDFKQMESGSSSAELGETCSGMYCALQEWNRENAAELAIGEHRIGIDYKRHLRPCNIKITCGEMSSTCEDEVEVCSSRTEGEILKYPCTCGISSRSTVVCSASIGILHGRETGQLCNAFNDWDGACQYRVCTSVDGTAFSTFYPCRCGTMTCGAGQRCNMNSIREVCEANYYRKSSNILESTTSRGGICTCPDGNTYEVGDNADNCGSLACENGVSGACSDDAISTANKGMAVTCSASIRVVDVVVTSLTADVAAGAHSVQVLDTSGMSAGSRITVSDNINSETKIIQSVLKGLHGHGRRLQAGGIINLNSSFQYAYSAGAGVTFDVGVCSDIVGRPNTAYPCKCGKSRGAMAQCTADQLCTASHDNDGVCKDYCEHGYKWHRRSDRNFDYCDTLDGSLLLCPTTEASAFACQQRCARISGCAHFSFFSHGGCLLKGLDAHRVAAIGVISGSPQCTQPNPSGYWRLENDSVSFIRAVIQNSSDILEDLALHRTLGYKFSNLTKTSFRINEAYQGGQASYTSDIVAGRISWVNGDDYVRTGGDVVSLAFGGENFCNSKTRKCKECQGDCDSDDDCAAGLLCVFRRANEPVAGCVGNGYGDVRNQDYCSLATVCPTTFSPTIIGCTDGSQCSASCTDSSCKKWDCCGGGKLAICPKGWTACLAKAANGVDMLCKKSCKEYGGNKQCQAVACSNTLGGASSAYPCRCGITANAAMQCTHGSVCSATNDTDGVCLTTTTTTLWCDWTFTDAHKFAQMELGTVWSKDACIQLARARGTCEVATVPTSVSESNPQICFCDKAYDRTPSRSTRVSSCWLDTLKQGYIEMVTTAMCGDAQAGSFTVLLCDVSLLLTGMMLKFPDKKHSQIRTIVSVSISRSKAQYLPVAGDVVLDHALDFSYMSGTTVMAKPDKKAACPWIYSVVTSYPDQVECQDGVLVQDTSCVEGGHGQRFKCPPNKPRLCAKCERDGYCCQSDCTLSGGDAQCPLEIVGCMDPSASNYNANATIDVDSCAASPFEALRRTTVMTMQLRFTHFRILNTSKFKEEQANAFGMKPEDIVTRAVQHQVTVEYSFLGNVSLKAARQAIAAALGAPVDNVTVARDVAHCQLTTSNDSCVKATIQAGNEQSARYLMANAIHPAAISINLESSGANITVTVKEEPERTVDIETAVSSNSGAWPEAPSSTALDHIGDQLGANISVKDVQQSSLCSRRMTAIMTTKATPLCVPSSGGRVKYVGELCAEGNILWTAAQALDLRPGLSPSRCKWNLESLSGVRKAEYFGSCGVAPTIEGGSQLPTSCRSQDYLMGIASQNNCPAYTTNILSKAICQSAALSLGSIFGPEINDQAWPYGCFQHKNRKFYLNVIGSGTGNEDATLVCMKLKVCTDVTGGRHSAYPCQCGKTVNATVRCTAGQSCMATNDFDGICKAGRPPPSTTCTWSTPHNAALNTVLCTDGTYADDWLCAAGGHGERAKCPPNMPVMCAHKRCGNEQDYCCESTCKEYGGPRPCVAAQPPPSTTCSWSSPHNAAVNTVLCTDGTFADDWLCAAGGHGQRAKCPVNMPIMCAQKSCGNNQDYCCESNCEEFGGPRPCVAAEADCGDLLGTNCPNIHGWHSTISLDLTGVTQRCVPKIADTNGNTCSFWCEQQGYVCLRAQDNIDGCELDTQHERKNTAENGCKQTWKTQICHCGRKATSCEAYNCTKSGWVKNATANAETEPDDDTCCEAGSD